MVSELQPLSPLPDNWDRAVAIVAHPDDLEYGSSCAIAQWTAAGKDIRYVLITSGEAGIATIEPHHCGPLRELEQKASAAVIGVDHVEFMGFPDGQLEPTLNLRRALAGVIRRHRPDVVFSTNFRETWGSGPGGDWNHPDHRVLGVSLLDAVRDAANPWMFTDQGEAWEGTQLCAFEGSPKPTHFAAVSAESLSSGIASLRCHNTYLSALTGDMADPVAFLTDMTTTNGERCGVDRAVTFEVFPTGHAG